ncbi:MAG: hypothetical protein IPJ75_13050 [Ignavibacteriales bacterium]|nr:hypothetical protein [Ignavibacteriales bacterium]
MVTHKSSIKEDVVYWEEIVQKYEEKLKGNYFLETLRIALRKYDSLKSHSEERYLPKKYGRISRGLYNC